ncbi:MAG: non-homologous end-joining DNA ligase [Terriglobia bacterium]
MKVNASGARTLLPQAKGGGRQIEIPKDQDSCTLTLEGQEVPLTNLRRLFWPALGLTKRDLLQYYVDVSPVLLPHLRHRAMVMKRYPSGVGGEFFFMKRAPTPRPEGVQICSIAHASGNVIGFPVVEDLASLLWVVNLGCIDLNPWYARCDDVDRPDYLNFDLDPVPGTSFAQVLDAALAVREWLAALKARCYPKTSGSRGMHIYVPIMRGPTQKQVWTFAKEIARALAAQHPEMITAEYRVAKRPKKHILVDYNQNAWGRTLASVYSLRPTAQATVSTPVGWEEVAKGLKIADFRIDNVPQRVRQRGDLWKPLLSARERVYLERLM